MTTTLNASTAGAGGFIATGDNSGSLALQTAGTTAVTIDTSQNVGIGTTSPTSGFKLDVATGPIRSSITAGGAGFEAGYSSGASYTYIQSYNRGTSASADLAIWGATTKFQYGSGASEAMRINSSGNVGIGTTNPDFGSFGAGERILGISNPTSGTRARLSFQNLSTGTSGVAGTLAFFNGSTQLGSLDVNADGATNKGYYAFNTNNGTSNSERMRINSDGSVMIGTTTNFGNGGFLDVDSTANVVNGINVKCNNVNYAYIAYTGTNFMYFTTSGTGPVGTITYNGSITVYGTTSDRRLKENIVDAPSAFDFINSLKIRSFDWKESGKHHKFGVIAQELVEVSEECVSVPQKEEDIWQVDTSPLIPALAKAVQELKAINDTQAETINALTARVVALESK